MPFQITIEQNKNQSKEKKLNINAIALHEKKESEWDSQNRMMNCFTQNLDAPRSTITFYVKR